MSFPFYQQPDHMDCGPTCLRIVAKYHGRSVSLPKLRAFSETTRTGSNLQNIAQAAEAIGFRTLGVKVSLQKILDEQPLPCILHWNSNHFVVLYKAKPSKGKLKLHVADPGHGLLTYTEREFLDRWIGANSHRDTQEGIALLLEPSPRLIEQEDDDSEQQNKQGFRFLFRYLLPHKKFIVQLAIGLLAGSLIQLLFPFLTQSVVDVGIQHRDVSFIWLVLIAQLFLYMGSTAIELIRGWILLHLSARINIALVSDFFIKLMKLPIGFFDVKQTGDILQRINDHKRIEQLLTTSSLSVLFSLFNLVLFGAVLAWYSGIIFAVFLAGSLVYVGWVWLFMQRRRDLDFKRFDQMSAEQSKVIELIAGMQEIKLHNAERQKRWGWEDLQARLFKVQMKSLALEQTQSTGSGFVNQVKNLFITILSAKLVIDGAITLGMMMSISYIIGQLNSPIQQLIGFMYTTQDAKIALERLSEVHGRADEESPASNAGSASRDPAGTLIHDIPPDSDLVLKGVDFRYPGSPEPVLKQLDLKIPARKVTAIVGSSGSGKTTLMKLLLKFYPPDSGQLLYGSTPLEQIGHHAWRAHCGTVMQEGFIFNDTVANNIAIGQEDVDRERLMHAARVANILDFIEELPLGFNTKIGGEGLGMSAGQKQRILIARAVYKQPQLLLFDEATSALDATNERTIMENLDAFLQGRTAVVIAHRLSTVKNADQIVVLDEGRIVEAGKHAELIAQGGIYFRLVRDQLQLEQVGAPVG
ncbi:MAG: peptidase domain-containing ABC transporter [Bacteroidetes bacterium]|nr:peptidase domain-containing ABC transporter [Bacteroidota bacterium]